MDVNILQSDMTEEMQDSVCDFIIQGFRKKIEYEDIVVEADVLKPARLEPDSPDGRDKCKRGNRYISL